MCNINCLRRSSHAFKRALQDNANFLLLQMLLIFLGAFVLLLLLGLFLVLKTSKEISLRLDELLVSVPPCLFYMRFCTKVLYFIILLGLQWHKSLPFLRHKPPKSCEHACYVQYVLLVAVTLLQFDWEASVLPIRGFYGPSYPFCNQYAAWRQQLLFSSNFQMHGGRVHVCRLLSLHTLEASSAL